MTKKYMNHIFVYILMMIAITVPSVQVFAGTVDIESFVMYGNESVFSQKTLSVQAQPESDVLYQFWINDLSVNNWIMIRDYSEESSVVWTPEKTGKYIYGVHVKLGSSTQRLDSHLYNSVTIRKPNLATLESLSINGSLISDTEQEILAEGISETGTLYQFWIKDLSTNRWKMLQDYSEKSSARWIPEKAGNYQYGVHIRDSNSQKELDAHLYKTITVRELYLASIKSLTIVGNSILGAEQEILAEGISETGTLYQFWIKDLSTNRWKMLQDYSEKSSARWVPDKAGDYQYGVHIKDKKSQKSLDTHQYNSISIRKPNSAYLESLSVDGNLIFGTEQEILAEGISETGTLYQFWIKDLSTNRWKMLQDYSEKSSARWVPDKAGEYQYGVHIKDKESQKRLDTHQYNSVNVRKPNSASLKSLSIDGNLIFGAEQEILAEGISETGTLYQFWIKDLSTNRWKMIQDYSAKSSVKWLPNNSGDFLYGVHIKDKNSERNLDFYCYYDITIRSPKPAVLNSLSIEGNDSSSSLKSISAKGNAENKILYQFWVKDLNTNKWIMIQDYSEKNSVNWIPIKHGKYLYGVHVKDAMSSRGLDAFRYVEIDIFGEYVYRYSHYQSTLQNALNEQMKKNPIKYSTSQVQEPATREQVEFQLNPNNYVPFLESENNIYMSRAQINVNQLNVRSGPSTNFPVISTVSKNQIFDILDESSGWYKIRSSIGDGWISSANCILLGQKRNAPVFDIGMFQFIVLSGTTGINESDLNEELIGRGILEGKASSFIIAGRKANINELYLVAHARLETGNGKSKLANGILITTIDGKQVDEPKVVYNMFGIGAIDGDALRAGSEFAYKQGWFTPEASIIGGAEWIGRGYINSSYYAQNTLYKMRWNPALPSHWHQYATDIGWATKQNTLMESLVNAAQRYNVTVKFDIPVYKK